MQPVACRRSRRVARSLLALACLLPVVWLTACDKLAGLGSDAAAGPVKAERIYVGGPILTMAEPGGSNLDQAIPVAEALAVAGGRIIAVGSAAEVMATRDSRTQMVDLAGKTLLPGFIDTHSHFVQAMLLPQWANLAAPPLGSVQDIPSLLEALRAQASQVRPGDWIVGWGYDPAALAEGRDVTRAELDAVFPTGRVLLLHAAGSAGMLNSAGLVAAGITATTPAPAGGVIVREPGSREPAGLVSGNVLVSVLGLLPRFDATLLANLPAVQAYYARHGYTTVNETALHYDAYLVLRQAAQQGRLQLDLVGLPLATELGAYRAGGVTLAKPAYEGRLKLGGVKFVIDAPVPAFANLSSVPLLGAGPNGELIWRGEPALPAAALVQQVGVLVREGVPVVMEASGDAAIGMALQALKDNGVQASQDRRDRLVHAQLLRRNQLEDFQVLGVMPSLSSNHLHAWADQLRQDISEERMAFMTPMRAVQHLMRMSNQTGYPATPLDPMGTVWSAANRTSRSGWQVGSEYRIDVGMALKALTLNAAWQYHEEREKGSLEVGKLADLVILDRNPLTADPATLRDIRVVETIKEGRTVWPAAQ